jgi:hypothetical protein
MRSCVIATSTFLTSRNIRGVASASSLIPTATGGRSTNRRARADPALHSESRSQVARRRSIGASRTPTGTLALPAAYAISNARDRRAKRELTAREDVLQRHVLDQEERPGAELINQAPHGRLDVLDDVAEMVRRARAAV